MEARSEERMDPEWRSIWTMYRSSGTVPIVSSEMRAAMNLILVAVSSTIEYALAAPLMCPSAPLFMYAIRHCVASETFNLPGMMIPVVCWCQEGQILVTRA